MADFSPFCKRELAQSRSTFKEKDQNLPDVNLLWGQWYGDGKNPEFDPIKKIQYLEKAYSLGSRGAQWLLIGTYLYAEDDMDVNYFRGVQLGSDYVKYAKNMIASGADHNGELNRHIGQSYLEGAGVEKNIDMAIKYFQEAEKLGDIDAKELLEALKSKGLYK